MDDLLDQIETGIQNNLYYLSLFVSLAIPDICGALESVNGVASGSKYASWFDKNVVIPNGYYLNGMDCYYFRCSMLHQGKTTHKNSNFTRILFVEPSSSNIFHNNIINKALNIDIKIFCNDMINATKCWISVISTDKNFIKNYKDFVRRHPKGLPPYISGVPVIS